MTAQGYTRNILLVEDNIDDRGRIHRMLRGQRRTYAITDCSTIEEAIEIVRARSAEIDCVLLDYHLPTGTGLDLINAIRGGGGVPVAVSVLTGQDDDDAAAATLEAGAEDFLLKDTLTPHALMRSIENVIERFEIRRQLDAQRAAVELRNQRLELIRDELQMRVAELAAATQARDRFMAMMSHEMRTPLNAVLGYAELLELELDGPLSETQHRHLERIRIGSRHLLDLINDVLDLARADADKLELDIRPVDVTAVLEEVQALLDVQAEQKHLALVVRPATSPVPLVLADLQRLRQIIMNLVGNAIKFTETGSVTMWAEGGANARCVCVSVSDTGIGMPPEVLPLVFKEFYQSDNALTRPYGGSGLGLAISRRLAHAMGGEIEVTSEPGKGSTFTLSLPVATPESRVRDEDVARHDARMHLNQLPAGATRAPVAVVAYGHDVDAMMTLANQVRPTVRLTWTTKESELVDMVRRERSSLVILDISSADGSAWRAAHSLAEMKEAAPPPAILLLPNLSAAPDRSSEAGVDLGWVSLVPKPFTAAQLTQAVTTAAEGQRRPGAPPPNASFDVLVVDDDVDSRRVARKFLGDRGIRVRESADGETGLTEMRLRPPDVVVLDLMMPVLDGFGVLATMRADPLLAGIPVVVLTAKSLTEAERQFLARTAARVLQKGEHRLADVAALVLRAAMRARGQEAAGG